MSFSLDIISKFARRKGFIYQGSEIYGGLANTWDYGPKGVLLKENIKKSWKEHFIYSKNNMLELDCGIFMNPKVWEASGHTAGFSDCLVDDKKSKHRFRADHLIEEQLGIDVEGKTADEITQIIKENKLKNPITKEIGDWTEARYMNLMFETNRDKLSNSISILEDLLTRTQDGQIVLNQTDIENLKRKLESQENGRIYLRPETAQGIFVQFKNILQTERPKLPFGVGQIGKAFRNEITPGNFNFRVIEFEQMEIEYFIKPPENEQEWNQIFEELLQSQQDFLTKKLGFKKENIRLKEHSKEKLSHYSKRTVDIEYNFPFGWSELTGLAYRTDFDLSQHAKFSGQDLSYLDPITNQKFIPHVMEPTVGLERLFLACLCEFYDEEEIQK